MDLEEFRERARRGERPLAYTLEMKIERLRAIFQLSIECRKKLCMIGGSILLDLRIKSHKLFFDWLTSETYDAYTLHSNGERRFVEPFVLSEHLDRGAAESIVFMPKNATQEEIELSHTY